MIFSFIDIILEQDSEYTYTEMAKELYKTVSEVKTEFHNNFDALQQALLAMLKKMFQLFPDGDYIEDMIRVDGLRERFLDGDQLLTLEYSKKVTGLLGEETSDSYDISWEVILEYLLEVVEEFLPYSTQTGYYLPFYATYSPPNISGRVNAQNSVFVCQTFMRGERRRNEQKPYRENLATQTIRPDLTVRIHNQDKILDQLDSIGINLKTVYGDYDNIAKYIKNQLYRDI